MCGSHVTSEPNEVNRAKRMEFLKHNGQMNLWHLFPSEATYKLDTFLAGGLWCADLGSIVGFDGDVEGDGPLGLFVSCWHATEGDPTSKAWQIFGEQGDGFAIRTTEEELRSYATSFRSPALAARMEVVSYVRKCVRITDPAFQVPAHHDQELEMRLLLELKDRDHDTDEIKKKMRAAAPNACEGRGFSRPVTTLTLSGRFDDDFAMILPINAPRLFKEFLIGAQVSPSAKASALDALQKAGVTCSFRQLEVQP